MAESSDSSPLGFLWRHFEEVKEHWKRNFAFLDYYKKTLRLKEPLPKWTDAMPRSSSPPIRSMALREEDGIARPVLNMLREVAQVNRANLWHQICAVEDENIHLREERQDEIVNFTNEKASLLQKLNELEATNNCLKAELKTELEQFSRERKELTNQLSEVENQLEWLRTEKDEEIAKLSADRRVLQERLHDAETQLSLLKARKRDELKRVVKEKNALAERLKSAEAARTKFDDELKRYATETVTREEVSLEDEVRRLTETVGQTEGEKREKEELVCNRDFVYYFGSSHLMFWYDEYNDFY